MSENKSSWQSLVESVLDWLKTVLPLTLFSAIVRYFRNRTWFAERKVEQKELELKMKENEDEIEKANRHKSDRDIVNDAIARGRELKERDTAHDPDADDNK
jgi:pyocin large subunit-like protein